jgi:hypothetical protein
MRDINTTPGQAEPELSNRVHFVALKLVIIEILFYFCTLKKIIII